MVSGRLADKAPMIAVLILLGVFVVYVMVVLVVYGDDVEDDVE
jgi:hypothetical protein